MSFVRLKQQSSSMMGNTFPDGRPLLEQPYRLLLAFQVIGTVQAALSKKPDQ